MEEINRIAEEVVQFSQLHLLNPDKLVTPKREDLAKIAIHKLHNKLLETKIFSFHKLAKNNNFQTHNPEENQVNFNSNFKMPI
jgi:hypothetical protein